MNAVYTAVVTANGRDGRATSTDGHLDVRLAFPPTLGGDGQGTNPEQLFAAGYALVEQAHAGCPYSKATRGNIPVELIVE